MTPLATVHTATLQSLLVVYRGKGDHVAARLIETELSRREKQ